LVREPFSPQLRWQPPLQESPEPELWFTWPTWALLEALALPPWALALPPLPPVALPLEAEVLPPLASASEPPKGGGPPPIGPRVETP
jgi:hypothetical protein